MEASSSNTYQLQFFKEHILDETKLLIFKILKNLPTDVHLLILTNLDQYEEWKIMMTLEMEKMHVYSSSEYSDPEEEYERIKRKEISRLFNRDYWDEFYSGNETD